jgi:hypothetical protein
LGPSDAAGTICGTCAREQQPPSRYSLVALAHDHVDVFLFPRPDELGAFFDRRLLRHHAFAGNDRRRAEQHETDPEREPEQLRVVVNDVENGKGGSQARRGHQQEKDDELGAGTRRDFAGPRFGGRVFQRFTRDVAAACVPARKQE